MNEWMNEWPCFLLAPVLQGDPNWKNTIISPCVWGVERPVARPPGRVVFYAFDKGRSSKGWVDGMWWLDGGTGNAYFLGGAGGHSADRLSPPPDTDVGPPRSSVNLLILRILFFWLLPPAFSDLGAFVLETFREIRDRGPAGPPSRRGTPGIRMAANVPAANSDKHACGPICNLYVKRM